MVPSPTKAHDQSSGVLPDGEARQVPPSTACCGHIEKTPAVGKVDATAKIFPCRCSDASGSGPLRRHSCG
jgi:hypothetical protein